MSSVLAWEFVSNAEDLQKKPVILVVDDEPILRLVLCEHLTGCGFHALEAFDAPNAIEIIESGVEIDAVLTDVKMPGEIDGVARGVLQRSSPGGGGCHQ